MDTPIDWRLLVILVVRYALVALHGHHGHETGLSREKSEEVCFLSCFSNVYTMILSCCVARILERSPCAVVRTHLPAYGPCHGALECCGSAMLAQRICSKRSYSVVSSSQLTLTDPRSRMKARCGPSSSQRQVSGILLLATLFSNGCVLRSSNTSSSSHVHPDARQTDVGRRS